LTFNLDEKCNILFFELISSLSGFELLLFFQRIVFGDPGQLGFLAQKLAGAELKLDLAPRLRLNAMMELVQDPEVTANLAIHKLVQVSKT
jgi:hypothetical protein